VIFLSKPDRLAGARSGNAAYTLRHADRQIAENFLQSEVQYE
jgi:hypothetical protein